MLKYVMRRILVLPVILFLVTVLLFLLIMLQPVDQRVMAYIPTFNPHIQPEQFQELLETQIHRYGLDDPFWVQYTRWLGNLLSGDWGYSPTWRQPVLDGLRQRAPATLELTLWAMVPSIILAILLGTVAALRLHRLPDHLIRAAASIGWAFPSFVLALALMNVFYAWLGWFPPGRMSIGASEIISSESYQVYTGMLTVDALLNGRPGLFWDALRRVLEINPKNRAARADLNRLEGARQPSPPSRSTEIGQGPLKAGTIALDLDLATFASHPAASDSHPATGLQVPGRKKQRLSQFSRRAVSSPALVTGCLIILFFLAVAIAAPILAPPEGDTPSIIPPMAIVPSRSHSAQAIP